MVPNACLKFYRSNHCLLKDSKGERLSGGAIDNTITILYLHRASRLNNARADRQCRSLCEVCGRCLSYLWVENHHTSIRFHKQNTLKQIKANASVGCRFCAYIAFTLRLDHEDFDGHDDALLQMSLPGTKAWKGYRFIHPNRRSTDSWDIVKTPGITAAFTVTSSRTVQILFAALQKLKQSPC